MSVSRQAARGESWLVAAGWLHRVRDRLASGEPFGATPVSSVRALREREAPRAETDNDPSGTSISIRPFPEWSDG